MEVMGSMIRIGLNEQQAREIAKTIYADIDIYIEQHRSEYEAFLKSEGYPESEVDAMVT